MRLTRLEIDKIIYRFLQCSPYTHALLSLSPLSPTEIPSHEAHWGMCFCMWWWLQTCSLTSPVVFCRTDQLEEVLKQLEKSLTDKCSEYFDEVESTIVDVRCTNQSFSLIVAKQTCMPILCCIAIVHVPFFFSPVLFQTWLL